MGQDLRLDVENQADVMFETYALPPVNLVAASWLGRLDGQGGQPERSIGMVQPELDNWHLLIDSSTGRAQIPVGVTEIDEDAFRKCDRLTSVYIPNSVTEICERAFCGCESLNEINIPSNVTKIGDGAFERCVSLTSVKFAAGVEEIGSGAFDGCLSLTSVEIPISVTKIGEEVYTQRTSFLYTLESGIPHTFIRGNRTF